MTHIDDDPTQAFLSSVDELFDNVPWSESEHKVKLMVLARDILEWAARENPDDRAEAYSFARLASVEATAQMLIEILEPSLGYFDLDDKIFWAKVGKEIGPDYITIMRGVSAFMARIDEFRIYPTQTKESN